jgi:hypothetical protein
VTEVGLPLPGSDLATVRAGRVRRFRRWAFWGVAALGAALLAATTFAFLGTNSTASASVTPSSPTGSAVYTSTPPTGVYFLHGNTTAAAPGWYATQGSVTSVKTAGDVAVIDGTNPGPMLITVALANPAALATAYSYVNIPVDLFECSTAGTSTCIQGGWSQVPTGVSNPNYLSFSNGVLTFAVTGAANTYFEVEVPTGGSFYTYNSAGTTGASFLVSAQLL